MDVSSFLDANNVEPFMQVLDEVIKDVGVKNVVQIVTYCASDCMEAVGKQLEEKAKIITKFIYSNAALLKPLKIRSAVPFLTLENIVSEEEKLKESFNSSEWGSSSWAERQVVAYREAKGSFGEGHASDQWSNISPEIRWSRYGGDYSQLQKLALRVLSQTCDGALKYQLKRSLAEELLAKNGKRNRVEQQHLQDLAFVHYNLQLKNFYPRVSTAAENIDPFSDWIVDHNDADLGVENNEPSSWMKLVDNNDAMTSATITISTGQKMNVEAAEVISSKGGAEVTF